MNYALIDKPDSRKQHKEPIVRIGGLSIAIGMLIGVFFSYLFGFIDIGSTNDFSLIFILSLLMFLLGILEDIYSLSFYKRLFFQVLIALIAWIEGLSLTELDFGGILINFPIIELSVFSSLLITIICIVGTINAFNWLDGLDGLLSGIVTITTFVYSLMSIISGVGSEQFLIFALLGSIIGFLYFNFNPAKIFMGDSGSYLIGSIIALYSIHLYNFHPKENFYSLNLLTIFLILFVPLFDMTYVVLNRIIKNKLPFFPDRQHIHHRILRAGFTHRETVLFCYLISFFFTSIAFFSFFKQFRIYIILPSIFLNLFFIKSHLDKFIFISKKLFKLK